MRSIFFNGWFNHNLDWQELPEELRDLVGPMGKLASDFNDFYANDGMDSQFKDLYSYTIKNLFSYICREQA